MNHHHEAPHNHSPAMQSELSYGSNIYDELVEALGDPTENKHVHKHSHHSKNISVEQLTGKAIKKSIPKHAVSEDRLSVGDLLERERPAPSSHEIADDTAVSTDTQESDSAIVEDDRARKAEAAIADFNQMYANGADYLAGKTRESAASTPQVDEEDSHELETSPKKVFIASLDKELAKLVDSGALSKEEAANKKKHASSIKMKDGLFSDDPAQDAVRFAHEGLDQEAAAAHAIGELDEAVAGDNHEIAAPSLEEVSQTIDELDSAVGLPADSNEVTPWMASETAPVPVVKAELESDNEPTPSHEKREGKLLSRVFKRKQRAKHRKTRRTAEKQSLREKFLGSSEQRELNSFLGEPGTIGFVISEWSRKRREKRYKKLSNATKQVQEQSDAKPWY